MCGGAVRPRLHGRTDPLIQHSGQLVPIAASTLVQQLPLLGEHIIQDRVSMNSMLTPFQYRPQSYVL